MIIEENSSAYEDCAIWLKESWVSEVKNESTFKANKDEKS